MSDSYTAPTVTTLGTVEQLTAQGLNKVGSTPDQFTPQIGIVGSVVPAPGLPLP